MPVLVCDPNIAEPLIQQRRASGLDRYDEVWDGVYVMSPIADNEHQKLATQLATVLASQIDWKSLGQTLAGANVSDRSEHWTENYRVPDVLVFLTGSNAEDRGTHWFGGPDFAIEIVSQGDRTLDKLDFYGRVGTRELLVIDRHPWKLTLYRCTSAAKLDLVAADSGGDSESLISEVIPMRFKLDLQARAIRILDVQDQTVRTLPVDIP